MDEPALIHSAREAIARGDQGAARRLLAQILHEQPDSEAAWMMMATLVEQPDRKRDCLERVLRIDPGNDVARAQLAALEAPQDQAQTGPAPIPEAAATALSPDVPGETAAAPAAGTPDTRSGSAAPEGAAALAEPEGSALQEPMGEVPTAAPPAEGGSEPRPTVPAPEAGVTSLAQPAPATAAVADEAATVLGNSLLVDSLAPGERALHRTTLTPWVFLGPLAAVLVAATVVSLPGGSLPEGVALAYRAVLLVLAFAYFGLRAVRYFGSEYVVTNRRVLAQCGFLARMKVDIPFREIEEVTVGRGSGRSGSLWIRRVGGTQVMFWRIREPGAFRDAIERGRAAISGN